MAGWLGYAPGSSEDVGGIAQQLWAQNILPSITKAAQPQSAPISGSPTQAGLYPGNYGSPQSGLDIARQINQQNIDYQRSNIPNYYGNEQQLSSTIGNLLNPADAQANYDVSMHGAEMGIGRGIPGSPAASETTGRLRQADIERRAALGANLMGQEVSWLPKPFDPSRLMLDPNNVLDQQTRISIEQARILNDLYNNQVGYSRGGYGHGGGYGYDPMAGTTRHVPAAVAGGGIPQRQAQIGGGYDETPWPGSTVYKDPVTGGIGWGFAPPPTQALVDNWGDLTSEQQAEYKRLYAGNPYNQMAPESNPYASEYVQPDPVLFGTGWQPGQNIYSGDNYE